MTVIKGYYLYNGKTLKPWFSSLGDWLSTELYFLMMGPVGAHPWNTTQQNMVKGSAFLQDEKSLENYRIPFLFPDKHLEGYSLKCPSQRLF